MPRPSVSAGGMSCVSRWSAGVRLGVTLRISAAAFSLPSRSRGAGGGGAGECLLEPVEGTLRGQQRRAGLAVVLGALLGGVNSRNVFSQGSASYRAFACPAKARSASVSMTSVGQRMSAAMCARGVVQRGEQPGGRRRRSEREHAVLPGPAGVGARVHHVADETVGSLRVVADPCGGACVVAALPLCIALPQPPVRRPWLCGSQPSPGPWPLPSVTRRRTVGVTGTPA